MQIFNVWSATFLRDIFSLKSNLTAIILNQIKHRNWRGTKYHTYEDRDKNNEKHSHSQTGIFKLLYYRAQNVRSVRFKGFWSTDF